MYMIAAIALGALAYWMDTRAIRIKAKHRIDCTANEHSLIILPDGRRMGIGVTSIETTSTVNEGDRVYIEGFLMTPDGRHLLAGQEVGKKRRGFSAGFEVEFEGGKKYKAGTVVHDTRGKRAAKARRKNALETAIRNECDKLLAEAKHTIPIMRRCVPKPPPPAPANETTTRGERPPAAGQGANLQPGNFHHYCILLLLSGMFFGAICHA